MFVGAALQGTRSADLQLRAVREVADDEGRMMFKSWYWGTVGLGTALWVVSHPDFKMIDGSWILTTFLMSVAFLVGIVLYEGIRYCVVGPRDE